MTLARKLSLAGLIVVVALMTLMTWLLATESGARFVLGRAQPYLPQELALGEVRGSLLDGIEFASLDWNSETADVAIRDVSVEVDLARLLSRHLAVRSLDVAGIDIATYVAADPANTGGMLFIDLPLRISVDSSSLRNVTIKRDDVLQAVDEIRVSASMKGSRLDVARLVISSNWLQADLEGRVTIAGDYPGRIQLNWRWSASPSVAIAGELEARGDLHRYDVEHTLRVPQEIATTGHVSYVDHVLDFDLASSWSALEWRVENSLLTAMEGTLRLRGNPSNIDVSFDTRAGFDDLPETEINLEGIVEPEKLSVTRLDAGSDLGRLVASGELRWQPGLAFDVTYSLEGLDPSLASGLLAGEIGVRGTATGERVAGVPKATVVVDTLGGQINDQPLGGGGTVQVSGGQIAVSNGRLQLGGNRLGVSGAVGDEIALDAQLEFPAIRELLPDASGSLSARIELRGSRQQPHGRLEMNGDDLSLADYAIANLAFDAAVSPAQDLAMSVNLGKARVGDSEIDGVNLEATGRLARHTLRAELRSNGSHVAAETVGAYVDGRWTGVARSLLVDNPSAGTWSLRDPADLVVSRDTLSMSRACFDQAVDTGQACVQAAIVRDRPTTFGVTISELPFTVLPLGLPAEVAASGLVDFQAEGSLVENRLTGQGSISLRDARIDTVVDDETISAAFATAAAEISMMDNRAVASLQLELADGVGSTTLDLTVDDFMDPVSALAGRGTVEISDLSLFAVLLPDISRPRGTINGSLDVAGSLAAPEFLGALTVSDGGFGFRKTGIEISNINARVAQSSAGRLQLEGSARSGNGEVTIRGDTWASADDGIRSELLITGNDFELSRLPDWEVAASPSIAVVFDDRRTTVTGNLFIPTTNVRVKDVPDGSETASPDTIVHRDEGSTAAARRRIDMDIAVGLGDEVRFAAFGLAAGIEGAVRIRGGTHAPYTGSGRLSLRDGRYDAYGQRLEIEQGQLIFNGPIENPQLDVRAVRRMTDVTAGIALSGTPSQLHSSLFSEPPLGDAETLSYLLTGRPLSSATSERDGNTLNAAAFALGVSSAGNIVSQVRTGIGLDTLAVEGGVDDGQLVAGKRFGNRLLVEYGYGLIDKLGTLLLRYELNDRITLESRTGTISNFDILYSVKKK